MYTSVKTGKKKWTDYMNCVQWGCGRGERGEGEREKGESEGRRDPEREKVVGT